MFCTVARNEPMELVSSITKERSSVLAPLDPGALELTANVSRYTSAAFAWAYDSLRA